jgi:hypothetical protein
VIHVYARGGELDRRFRMGGMRRRVHSPALCGADTEDGLSRANAEAAIDHAVRVRIPSAIRLVGELCPECRAQLGA